jgi:cellulose/xylan binding protein with CBM9 domain
MRLAALVVLVACVDQGAGPQGKKIDPAYIADNVLKEPPQLDDGFSVDLGGRVTYLGSQVDKKSVAPGGTVRISHYWQVNQPPGADWKVFAFVRGAPNTADFMNLPATDMAAARGPATWRAGEIIRDIQDVTLRPDWRSPTATLYVGLIQAGAHGVGDRMIAIGPHVVDRAIVARTFDIDLSRAPAPIGSVYIQRAAGAINIDGIANDPGWAGVPTSPEFVQAEGSPEVVGKASAKLTWDDTYLYAFISIVDNDIYSEYKKHDDPLWKADAVELFIDADGNKRGYVELQVNPNNATFDSWFAGGRAPKGDEAWDSGMITAVKVRGTPDVAGDTDQGWDVEIAIPWAAVKGRDEQMAVRLPPQTGDKWRLNVVRIDKSGDKPPSASSWNRISNQDVHGLERMLTAVFADQSGSIVAKPDGQGSTQQGSAAQGSGSNAQGAQGSNAQGSNAQGSAATHQLGPAGAPPGARQISPGVTSGSGAGELRGNPYAPTPVGPNAGSNAKTNQPKPSTPTGDEIRNPFAPAGSNAGSGAKPNSKSTGELKGNPFTPGAGSGAKPNPGANPTKANDEIRSNPFRQNAGSGSAPRP